MSVEQKRAELQTLVLDPLLSPVVPGGRVAVIPRDIMAAADAYAQARALAAVNDYIAARSGVAEVDPLAGNPLQGIDCIQARIEGEKP